MNVPSNTTTGQKPAMTRDVAAENEEFRKLEGEIHDVRMLADIAASLLEDWRYENDTVTLTRDEADRISFLVVDASYRSRLLAEHFDAATLAGRKA